MEQVTKEKKH